MGAARSYFGVWLCLSGSFLLSCGSSAAVAGLGPENVAVVVNADSWASLTIANTFASLRKVPSSHLIYLKGVSGQDQIGVEEFRESLLKPVLSAIAERGLSGQIDCIAWSADFPTAIDVSADLGPVKDKLPRVLTPVASLNGLTYLHELVLQKNPLYLDLNANWYYRRPVRKGEKPGEEKPGPMPTEAQVEKFRAANRHMQDKKWAEASPLLKELAEAFPKDATLSYNLACSLAREGKPDDAIAALKQAVRAGWFDRRQTEKDEDLASLREREDYRELLKTMSPPQLEVSPAVGFRSRDRWNARGERVESEGRRYLLSTVLAVTSGRGLSVPEAVEQLTRAASAPSSEADVRSGTVYFVKNGDVRSTTREWAFASAVEALRAKNVRAEIVDGTLPAKKTDVAGAVIGIAGFDWPKSESRILPGAIVEHLTSFGGIMREDAGQTPLTEFLRNGAAGSSGTVTEPYAIQAKFPSPFLHVHYASGATLAEAFYLSVQGPYQLLIVGDPLCAPWAKRPRAEMKLSAARLARGDSLNVEIRVPEEQAASFAEHRFFVDGRLQAAVPSGTKTHALVVDSLSDGWHELRLTSVDSSPMAVVGSPDAVEWFELVREKGSSNDAKETGSAPLDPIPSAFPGIHPDQMAVFGPVTGESGTVTIQSGVRALASVVSGSATVGIPAQSLGAGRQFVRSIRETANGLVLGREREIVVNSAPPEKAWIPAQPAPVGKLTEGMRLQTPGQEPIVVAETRDGQWLAGLKLPPGAEFTLEGDFEHAEPFGQFLTAGNCGVIVQVDGRPVSAVGEGKWEYRPFWAQPGWHRMTVRGRIPADGNIRPELVIRYGGAGLKSLNGRTMRHASNP